MWSRKRCAWCCAGGAGFRGDAAFGTWFLTIVLNVDAEDKDTRLAAAFVLGHANGPVVTNALIDVVSRPSTNSTEAWIALMACRGPQADQFLTYATRQPHLLGSFNRARVYWARMIN